jgi:dihydrofolate synthase / folylpolyglutamate synthase
MILVRPSETTDGFFYGASPTFVPMDYAQTLDYLYTRLPMFSRIGAAAYKKDLHNTIALCEAIGNPQQQLRAVHIAGTNGKGSVSHMLAAIFQSAGYKTGLYTSPHLKDFRERIKVNGKMITEAAVVEFTERIQPQIDQLDPSFFEVTVAMAYDYFVQEKVDIAIIETGLGGRLDSTNIITPDVSVITNIGWDHMNLLGDTLEKIAAEKAGIIKPGVPVVIGETIPETAPVFESTANEKKSPLYLATAKRHVVSREWKDHLLQVEVGTDGEAGTKKYTLDLSGIYQIKNLLTVLETCDRLQEKGWILPEEKILSALKTSKQISGLHGRWEIIHTDPLLVLDVAHNEDGIKQLLEQIQLTPHDELHIVLGMVKDKEVEKVLTLLPKKATYYFTQAGIQRAMEAYDLFKLADRYGLKGNTYSSVNTAIYAASMKANNKDLIVVCGSIFLVGEVSQSAVNECWKERDAIGFPFLELALEFFW